MAPFERDSPKTENDSLALLNEEINIKVKKVQAFWAAFQQEQSRLFTLDSHEMVQKGHELLNEHLEGVVLEFVMGQDKRVEKMVFSANGLIEHFQEVILLTQYAPDLNGIAVESFRQRVSSEHRDFSIQMDGLSLSSQDIWVSLMPDSDTGRVNTLFYLAQPFEDEQLKQAHNMSVVVMDHVLGEYDGSVKVGWIDFVDEKSEHQQWVTLVEMPERLDELWKQQLGHTQYFPEEKQTKWASFQYQPDEDDEDNTILGVVNESAHAVACRADFGSCLIVSVAVSEQEVLERAYALEEALVDYLQPMQQGLHVLSLQVFFEERRDMIFYVSDEQAVFEYLKKIVPQFDDLEISFNMLYDPRWENYYQWAPAYQAA